MDDTHEDGAVMPKGFCNGKIADAQFSGDQYLQFRGAVFARPPLEELSC
jgi:hypothetical protein